MTRKKQDDEDLKDLDPILFILLLPRHPRPSYLRLRD